MNNGVKLVIAIGAVMVTTQLLGLMISKKLIKFSRDAFASLNPEDTSFVDTDGEEDEEV